MDEVEGTLEVNGQNSIPLGLSHLEHKSIFGDAGIVYQDIYPSEFLNYLGYCIVSLLEVSGVGSYGHYLYAKCFQFFLCLLPELVYDEISESDICSFSGKLEGNCLADSSCSARNEGNLSFE